MDPTIASAASSGHSWIGFVIVVILIIAALIWAYGHIKQFHDKLNSIVHRNTAVDAQIPPPVNTTAPAAPPQVIVIQPPAPVPAKEPQKFSDPTKDLFGLSTEEAAARDARNALDTANANLANAAILAAGGHMAWGPGNEFIWPNDTRRNEHIPAGTDFVYSFELPIDSAVSFSPMITTDGGDGGYIDTWITAEDGTEVGNTRRHMSFTNADFQMFSLLKGKYQYHVLRDRTGGHAVQFNRR